MQQVCGNREKPSCIIGRNANWYSHYGNHYGNQRKKNPRNRSTIGPSYTTPGQKSKGLYSLLQRYLILR